MCHTIHKCDMCCNFYFSYGMVYFLYQTQVVNSIILGINVSKDIFDTAMLINNKMLRCNETVISITYSVNFWKKC